MSSLLLRELEESINKSKDKFQYISKWYFNFHKKRYVKDISLVKKILKNGNIIEMGAAPFHETFLLQKTGYEITGIDKKPERYKKFLSANKLKIIKTDIEKEKIPFEDNKFDLALMNEVFEHLTDPIHALLETNRVLKKEGTLILTTPNLYYFSNIIKYLLGKGAMQSPFRAFSIKYSVGTSGHVREYTNFEMNEFLTNTNFTIKKTFYRRDNSFLNPKRIIIYIITCIFPFLSPYQVFIAKKDNRMKQCMENLRAMPILPQTD